MGQEGDYCIKIEFARKLGDEFSPISIHVSENEVGRILGRISLSLLILPVDKENNSTAIEHNSTHFTRLSLFRDLEGSEQIKLLKTCRVKASQIEEFFIGLSNELWLRTVLEYKDKVVPEGSHSLSQLTYENLTLQSIQSNVVPCHQYWEKLRDARMNYAAGSTTRGFPSTYLEMSDPSKLEAHFTNTREENIQEEKRICDLMTKQTTGGTNSRTDTRPFWKIEPEDVEDFDELNYEVAGSGGNVLKMLWRGGRFASKVLEKPVELKVLRELGTHPHIVYSFGVSIPEDGLLKYWIELMDTDLFALVQDLSKDGVTSMDSMDSMNILLHIAEAMKHLHEKNVVHGDLKPGNVLISHCDVLGDAKHYIVKLADFDCSCRIPLGDLVSFELSRGTLEYAAPEFSEAEKIWVTASDAKKTDVYSFGVLAVEVLTGWDIDSSKIIPKTDYIQVKRDSIPALLKEDCGENCKRLIDGKNYNPRLINLIDNCFNIEPADRPSFEDLTTALKYIILEQSYKLKFVELSIGRIFCNQVDYRSSFF